MVTFEILLLQVQLCFWSYKTSKTKEKDLLRILSSYTDNYKNSFQLCPVSVINETCDDTRHT